MIELGQHTTMLNSLFLIHQLLNDNDDNNDNDDDNNVLFLISMNVCWLIFLANVQDPRV